MFLLIYLVQQKQDWSIEDVVNYLPEPIKSLQNVPLAVSYVFGDLTVSKPGRKKGGKRNKSHKKNKSKENAKTAGRNIARHIPGYSNNYRVNDDDAIEETRLMNEALAGDGEECGCTSVDLCQRLSEKLNEHLDNETKTSDKVSLEYIKKYNNELVHAKDSDEIVLGKLFRHKHLFGMIDDEVMSKGKQPGIT